MSAEDRKRSKELLPLLNRLGEEHPDGSVKAMALDLRFAIATHGFLLTKKPQRDVTESQRKSPAKPTSQGEGQKGKKEEKPKAAASQDEQSKKRVSELVKA